MSISRTHSKPEVQRSAASGIPTGIEWSWFNHARYDQVFTSLEASINSRLIRDKVEEALQLSDDADTLTHKALLRLATDPQGVCRLVTTNYDSAFLSHTDSTARLYPAPRLPVPKPGRWNGIVHLHGWLEDCGSDKQELVLSSADFGAAYLVDGWATRFLLELFQHYTVLFVGYRADDLVVRYMLQALAVSLAGRGARVLAFAEIEDDEGSTTLSWKAKGIEPILYAKQDGSHAALHDTLRTWAEYASHGLLGRQTIVAERISKPVPVERDEVVDQVLWALKDTNGATAKFLADLNDPSPSPREWLATLDEAGLFSLDSSPLVDNGGTARRSDVLHPVTWNLARWLCRHLAEPKVLDWVLAKGGSLNPGFRWLVRDALANYGDTIPVEMGRAWSFLARPSCGMGPGWRGDLFALGRQIESRIWDFRLQHEVAVAIEPFFVLKRDSLVDAYRRTTQSESDSYPIEVEVTFADADDVASVLDSIRGRPDRDSVLTSLLDDCTTCLRRAMEMRQYLGKASSDQDWTFIWVSSINPSANAHSDRPLVALIKLAAACLDAAVRINPLMARSQVEYWKTIDYPVFLRLVCYALARLGLFSIEESLAYTLGPNSPTWHPGCRAELCQLLAHLWPLLDAEQSRAVIQVLLDGPAPGHDREDLRAEDVEELSAREVEKRLIALQGSGRPLPQDAEEFLARLSAKYAPVSVDPSEEEKSLTDLTTEAITVALADGIGDDLSLRRRWSSMLSDDWQRAFSVLRDLATIGKWPADVWTMVLNKGVVWTINDPPHAENVNSILDFMANAPDAFIAAVSHSLAQLLELAPRLTDFSGGETYWRAWDRALSVAVSESAPETRQMESLSEAVNTAPGRLTEALFERVRQRSGAGEHDVPKEFWERLRTACDPSSAKARGARSRAAMHFGWLYSKNCAWMRDTILPSLDWSRPEEASAVWQGFLCSHTSIRIFGHF